MFQSHDNKLSIFEEVVDRVWKIPHSTKSHAGVDLSELRRKRPNPFDCRFYGSCEPICCEP
jgi:hypothetical protein